MRAREHHKSPSDVVVMMIIQYHRRSSLYLHHLSLALHLHAPSVLARSLSQKVAADCWNHTLEEADYNI